MKNWKRFLILVAATGGLFFMLGFFKIYHLPKLERWLLIEIERQSDERLPVRVWPQSLEISFLPPGVVLHDVRLLPKKPLAATLAPTVVSRLEVRINWFYLLIGRLRLSYVGADGAEIKLVVKERLASASQPKGPGQISPVRQILDFPVDELRLSHITLWTRLESQGVAFHLADFYIRLEGRSRSLLVDFRAPQADVKLQGTKEPIPLHIATRALIDEKSVRLTALQIKAGQSFIVGAGMALGGLEPGLWERIDVQARTQVDLADAPLWQQFMPSPIWDDAKGVIKAEIAVEGSQAEPVFRARIGGQGMQLKNRIIGDFEGDGRFEKGVVTLDRLKIENSAGQASLKRMSWRAGQGNAAKATITVDRLEIGQLLANLGAKGVPLTLPVKGDFSCTGPLLPRPSLFCEGDASIRDFSVTTGKPKRKTIVALAKATAKGEVTVTTSAVTYKASLTIGDRTAGVSAGTIDFKKGFQIQYQSDNLDFTDIKNLVNLKLTGTTKIKGTTEGGTKWARVKMNLDARDLWLEDFGLGDPAFELTYRDGSLKFADILAQLGSTRYGGLVAINLHRNEIFIEGKSSYAELADIKQVFSRKVTLPFAVSGSGTVEAKGSGPLQFNQLSYTFKSSFFRGAIAGESFDQLTFNVSAKDGKVATDRVTLSRSSSNVDLNGRISPAGLIDAVAIGRRLRLEESENIGRLGLDMAGQIDFTMSIKGQLPQPNFETHGRLSRLVIGDRAADDSTFKIKLTPDHAEGGGSFIGGVVETDFNYPFTESQPFRFLARAKNWNFANMFSILSSSARQKDFTTSMSGTIDLRSNRGGPSKASGTVELEEFVLKHGAVGIQNKEKVMLNFKDGVLRARPFSFEGDGGFLKFSFNEISPTTINAAINGKVDMSLLSLATPFFADLQGRLALNMVFSGQPLEPQISGSAYIDQGILRFRGFPQSFSDLRSDLLFSRQDVIINSLKATLGDGVVTGDGRVRLLGRNSIPVDVKGHFNDVTLNVPEGFRTQGSGSWQMSGPYFPYTLLINYNVSGGEITSEFGGQKLGEKSISPSMFLPKFIVQSAEHPIDLDLTVDLKNPIWVKNSTLQTQARGKLLVKGPPTSPRLTGSLTAVPGGQLFFREVPFEVTNGLVEYHDDPPENPKLYITAQSTVVETVKDDLNATRSKENEYEISLVVQGRAKPQPKFTLTSQPALAEKEIVSLLALGMTPSSLEANRTASQLAFSNASQIGVGILQKPLNKGVKRLGVDVQVTQATSSTENASIPKVTINKQLTPNFTASAGRTVEKDPTNSIKMEYKVNKNFSVVGSWDGKEGTSQLEEQKDVSPSIFGLDLEYKVNFR